MPRQRAQSDELISLLLRAGELECALHDAGSDGAANAASLTDLFADAAVEYDAASARCDGRRLAASGMRLLGGVLHCGTVSVGAPEGFAYYALHPLDYTDLVEQIRLDAPVVFVIGIRSIGTTLSAVVAAKLRHLGRAAERMTARPTGHPYDRRCDFDPLQRLRFTRALASNAAFLICDEGPGRSGSSFLSVAEALEREGVPRDQIALLCSHQPHPAALCAPDGPRRWRRYRSLPAGQTRRLPADAGVCLSGGEWRRKFFGSEESWPAVWPQMERLRYLSRAENEFLQFEGYGPYGAQVRSRNEALSDSGFGNPYLGQSDGFGRHILRTGRRGQPHDIGPSLLTRMAEYCAWRSQQFPATDADASELATMAQVNFEREFGVRPEQLALPVERPAVCDAHIHPHSWLHSDDGRWLKLDGATHGDDHFFPGPCDIAWDLAGTVIEWNLEASARDFLLSQYRRASGDDATQRIAGYELAYAVFRMAWCKMAAESVTDVRQRDRLLCDYQRYRLILEQTTASHASVALQ
ncbi:MAG: hypothetical protein WA655_08440 [Candidatus Korobacteraceae bacterium]